MAAAVYVSVLMGGDEFGSWLEARMADLGLSQAELEKASGVSAGQIHRYRNGMRTPDPATIQKLAGPLQADIDQMLTLAGHKPGDAEPPRTFIVRTENPKVWRIAQIAEQRASGGRSDDDIDRAIRLLETLFDED